MARASAWDLHAAGCTPPRPTLSPVNVPDIDIVREACEAQARVIERRTIRLGRDAWEAINKTQ
jgi:hypothetical protein